MSNRDSAAVQSRPARHKNTGRCTLEGWLQEDVRSLEGLAKAAQKPQDSSGSLDPVT